MSTQATFFAADQATTTLFDLFENSTENNSFGMFQQLESSQPSQVDASKPRQILGESVFNQFVKTEELNQEFPLGLEKLVVPELSPSVGTVTPLQLHSSVVESIFSPSALDSTPMFDDIELDSSNWKSLFEPSEMEIPAVAPAAASTAAVASSTEILTSLTSSPSASPNFIAEQVRPSVKRSSSEAELDLPLSNRSDSLVSDAPIDEDGIVAYNRKQRQQPLSPIVSSSGDTIAQKRARNTEAARRSRARKMERMNQLEDKVDVLKKKNSDLEEEVARLRALLALR